MKPKTTQNQESVLPLEDGALEAVTGGWLPDITLPNPDSPNNNTVNGITCVCRKCGKQFTWSGGSTVLCDGCKPNLPKILTP